MTTPRIEEMKLQVGNVVVCDGLSTGKAGKVLGVGSSPHSIKLLIDGNERYEPDYALLEVTDQNKRAVELLLSHLTQAHQAWIDEGSQKMFDDIKADITSLEYKTDGDTFKKIVLSRLSSQTWFEALQDKK